MGRIGGVMNIFSEEAIAGATTVYSKSIRLSSAVVLGIWYKATSSAGAPDVTIQIEMSYTTPSTESASDSNYVIPVNLADVDTNLITENAKIKSISLPNMPYMRFKITGNAGNAADTLLTIRLSIQEEV